MSREIKFRAFVDNKRMIDHDWMKLSDWTYIDMVENKLGVLMQYTGLKDKNGKEIYEGDIVYHEEYYSGDNLYPKGIFTIEFEDGAFNLDHAEIINNGIYIIGNIYENPELLEQS